MATEQTATHKIPFNVGPWHSHTDFFGVTVTHRHGVASGGNLVPFPTAPLFPELLAEPPAAESAAPDRPTESAAP